MVKSRAQKKLRQTSGQTVEDPTMREEQISPRISDLATRADNPDYVKWDKSSQLARKKLRKISYHFGAVERSLLKESILMEYQCTPSAHTMECARRIFMLYVHILYVNSLASIDTSV